MCIYIYIYVHIHIHRERERERERLCIIICSTSGPGTPRAWPRPAAAPRPPSGEAASVPQMLRWGGVVLFNMAYRVEYL